jgi:hypothetical protein
MSKAVVLKVHQFDSIMQRMTSDRDIWRAANMLIIRCGDLAEIEACRLADLMLDRGDRDGELLWLRVRRTIAELQAPPAGSPN